MRTKRSIAVPAAGAAVLLAAGLALIVPGSSPHSTAHSPATTPTAAQAPPAPNSNPSPTATASAATVTVPPTSEAPSPEPAAATTPAAQVPSGVAAAGDGPQGDAAIQAALNAQRASDLPAETAQQLSALARDVWTAEATGEGRQRWPDYFPAVQGVGGRPYFYTGFRVQATIAHTAKGDPEHAAVDLLWAGTSPTGEYGDHRPALVTFTLVNGTWEPRR